MHMSTAASIYGTIIECQTGVQTEHSTGGIRPHQDTIITDYLPFCQNSLGTVGYLAPAARFKSNRCR